LLLKLTFWVCGTNPSTLRLTFCVCGTNPSNSSTFQQEFRNQLARGATEPEFVRQKEGENEEMERMARFADTFDAAVLFPTNLAGS